MPEPDASGFVALPVADRPARSRSARSRTAAATRRSASAPDGIWRATRTPDGPRHHPAAGRSTVASRSRPGVPAPRARSPERPTWSARTTTRARWCRSIGCIGELIHRFPGLRLPRTNRPFDALLPAICEQKVSGVEARAAFRGIIASHGEAGARPGRASPPAGPGDPRGAPLLRLPSVRPGAAPRRPHPPRRAARPAHRGRDTGGGLCPAWRGAGNRSMDAGRGRPHRVRRSRRDQRRRLPPAERGGLGARPASRARTMPACSSCWSRTAASGARPAPAGGERDRSSALRAAHGSAADRRRSESARVASPAGFEPATRCLEGSRSGPLSYGDGTRRSVYARSTRADAGSTPTSPLTN